MQTRNDGARDVAMRSFVDGDLQIRSGGDGRTVYGLAVPFDTEIHARDFEGDYHESFSFGAFTRTLNANAEKRVKVFVKHDTSVAPLGVAAQLRQDPAGLLVELSIAATRSGDDALELVRAGALDQFSIGFMPYRTDWSDIGMVDGPRRTPASGARAVRKEVALREVSLVDYAAYPTAEIAGVRIDAHTGNGSASDALSTHQPVTWAQLVAARATTDKLQKYLERMQ